MRRWFLILLLLVYPFQVTLAMVDGCCVATSTGITHHSAGAGSAVAAEPVLLPDEAGSILADPHCPACTFGQISGVPLHAAAMPAAHHRVSAVHTPIRTLTSVPARRPERPKWPAATW
jgi:hypothetical protein